MLNISKKVNLISKIIIILVLASGLGYYFYLDYQKSQVPEDQRLKTIKEIISLTLMKPDLTEEQQKKYQEDFQTEAEAFLKGPETAEGFWPVIGIAQVKELVNDYDGAKQALIWAVELQPQSYVAHGNLANLYFHHYQDFPKAEEHLLKAIEPDSPRTTNYYLELHELYRYFYKQNAGLAEDILKQGIERYPQATDLMTILAHYYKDLGKKDEARKWYQKILEINPDSQVSKNALQELE